MVDLSNDWSAESSDDGSDAGESSDEEEEDQAAEESRLLATLKKKKKWMEGDVWSWTPLRSDVGDLKNPGKRIFQILEIQKSISRCKKGIFEVL